MSPPGSDIRETAADFHRRPPRLSIRAGRGVCLAVCATSRRSSRCCRPTRASVPDARRATAAGGPRAAFRTGRSSPRAFRAYSGTPGRSRWSTYYAEVSTGRLRIVPHRGRDGGHACRSARTLRPAAAGARERRRSRVRPAAGRRGIGPRSRPRTRSSCSSPARAASRTCSGRPGRSVVELRRAGAARRRRLEREACVAADSARTVRRLRRALSRVRPPARAARALRAGRRAHEGIGVWGLMGQGTWLGRGDQPPHHGSLVEAPARLGRRRRRSIARRSRRPAAGGHRAERRASCASPPTPGNPDEYYLLENRACRARTRALPGEGSSCGTSTSASAGFRTGAEQTRRHKLLHLGRSRRTRRPRPRPRRRRQPRRRRPIRGPGRRAGGAWAAALAGARRRAWPSRSRSAAWSSARRSAAGAALGRDRGRGARWPAAHVRRAPVCGPGTPGMAPYDGEPARVVAPQPLAARTGHDGSTCWSRPRRRRAMRLR